MKKLLNSWTGIVLKILGICALFLLIMYIIILVVNNVFDVRDVSNIIAPNELM